MNELTSFVDSNNTVHLYFKKLENTMYEIYVTIDKLCGKHSQSKTICCTKSKFQENADKLTYSLLANQ